MKATKKMTTVTTTTTASATTTTTAAAALRLSRRQQQQQRRRFSSSSVAVAAAAASPSEGGGRDNAASSAAAAAAAAAPLPQEFTPPPPLVTLLSHERHNTPFDADEAMLASKLWFLINAGSLAFVLPFYNVFLNSHGITAAQLGLLAALRPAVGAPAAAGISALADRTGRHRAVLATCFTLAALGRLAVPLEPGNFPWQLALALATEGVAAPVSVIADAAVVAAAPTEDGYGRARMFGAVGWGAFSLAAGALVAAKGVHFGFLAYAATAAIALIPTLLLPLDALRDVVAPEEEGGEKAAALSKRRRTPPRSSNSNSSSKKRNTASSSEEKATTNAAATTTSTTSTTTTTTTTTTTSSGSFVDLLSNKKTSVFLGLALTLGFANGAIASFLPLYLSDLGGSETLLGAAIAVA